jgi:hypothetical protein
LTTITPLAPSQIWLALAALMHAAFLQQLDRAMPSSVASKRMPSSTVCGARRFAAAVAARTSTGTISASKRPACVAAIARGGFPARSVEVVARQAVLARHHLGAGELAELHAGITRAWISGLM